jgi:hypothetical protein
MTPSTAAGSEGKTAWGNRNPGPGAYDARLPREHRKYKFAQGERGSVFVTNDNPGPSAYDVPGTIGTAPAFTFCENTDYEAPEVGRIRMTVMTIF